VATWEARVSLERGPRPSLGEVLAQVPRGAALGIGLGVVAVFLELVLLLLAVPCMSLATWVLPPAGAAAVVHPLVFVLLAGIAWGTWNVLAAHELRDHSFPEAIGTGLRRAGTRLLDGGPRATAVRRTFLAWAGLGSLVIALCQKALFYLFLSAPPELREGALEIFPRLNALAVLLLGLLTVAALRSLARAEGTG